MIKDNKKYSFAWVLAIYLIGVIVGGIYMGIVAPVRTVMQDSFTLSDESGIWVITIYSLFYAAFIPVIGKLADRYGRKRLFLICMVTFVIGSAICGFAGWLAPETLMTSMESYTTLLFGRILQAIGACGLIPLATAEIGVSAPPDKQGMYLGIIAASSGISSVLGSGVGSLIMDVIGPSNWAQLFFVCVPIGIFCAIVGYFVLPESKLHNSGKIDYLGSISIIGCIFFLLLGITYVSDENYLHSFVQSKAEWVLVLIFAISVVSLIVFIIAERRAEDPILDPVLFTRRAVVITLILSFFIGCLINSMTLIPAFCEDALRLPAGSGGIYMMVFGIFSLFGPIVGGTIVDKRGAKPVLIGGLVVAALGYAFLTGISQFDPDSLIIIVGLSIVGLGLGFAMGPPTNYMILHNVPEEHVTSAISALTLMRQIGVSVAPAVYVAFIRTDAGASGYTVMLAMVCASAVLGLIVAHFYRENSPGFKKK